jgi:hypothetical protein
MDEETERGHHWRNGMQQMQRQELIDRTSNAFDSPLPCASSVCLRDEMRGLQSQVHIDAPDRIGIFNNSTCQSVCSSCLIDSGKRTHREAHDPRPTSWAAP